MCSYFVDPMIRIQPIVDFYQQVTLVSFSGGVGLSLVASVLLLRDPRRFMAIGSIAIGAIYLLISGHYDRQVLFLLLSFTLLVSVVVWPTQRRWINWPLLAGAGVASFASAQVTLAYASHPCAN